MEKIMLKLIEFRHKHHPSGVKMLENLIRRGIPVQPGEFQIIVLKDAVRSAMQFAFLHDGSAHLSG
jgi:predicted regulator of amino acid metabolism with ACT domain